MFGISSFEFLVILLVGVVALGPEKLPKLLRLIAGLTSELRRMTVDLQRSINLENTLTGPVSLKKQAEDLFFGKPAPKAKPTETETEKPEAAPEETPASRQTEGDTPASDIVEEASASPSEHAIEEEAGEKAPEAVQPLEATVFKADGATT
ncbi:MAG: hypothetical protein FWG17_07580 [Desulfovibrionaceae bacterium]|nr:hypothetical protein [Desulfovibrionaceae bacterium]